LYRFSIDIKDASPQKAIIGGVSLVAAPTDDKMLIGSALPYVMAVWVGAKDSVLH